MHLLCSLKTLILESVIDVHVVPSIYSNALIIFVTLIERLFDSTRIVLYKSSVLD